VNWEGGVREFRDTGTQDGYLGGTAYRYCGFSEVVGLHLVGVMEEDVFTGALLDHGTGRVMTAGKAVMFTPDGSKYFARVQPNGLDGERWYLYERDGSMFWEGLSGVSEQHPSLGYDYFVATLDRPRWNDAGDFQASLSCTIGRAGPVTTVTLTRDGSGWTWLPVIRCPRGN